MFVKLDDNRILDMATGTCCTYFPKVESQDNESSMVITFNGPQRDKFCSGSFSDSLWTWLNSQALTGEKGVTNASAG